MPLGFALRPMMMLGLVAVMAGIASTPTFAEADDPENLLRAPGFETLPQGELSVDGEPWHVTREEAATYTRVHPRRARSGDQALVLSRGRGTVATAAQVIEGLEPDIYELTVWAEGSGELILVAGEQRRHLAATDEWQQYSFIFEVEEEQDVLVGLESLGEIAFDDAALVAAGASLRDRWREQEAVRDELGFVPAAASAQRPAPGEERLEWSMPDAPPEFTHRAVYYDPRYEHRGGAGPADVIADYLGAHGFEILDAPSLGEWMRERAEAGAYGSVAVMAKGVAPTSVLEVGDASESTMAEFLRAGGRVVWFGGTPLYRSQDETQPRAMGRRHAIRELLGIRSGATPTRAWDFARTQRPERTELGERWGLPSDGVATLAAYEEDVTAALTRLYDEELDVALAGAWFKNVNSDYPWSGFVYDGRTVNIEHPAHLPAAYHIALFTGESIETPPLPAPAEDEPQWQLAVTLDPSTDRSSYLRGETVPVRVGLDAAGQIDDEGVTVNALLTEDAEHISSRLFHLDDADGEGQWSIDTTDLAVGEYDLRITLWDSERGAALAHARRELVVRPTRPDPTFFFGAFASAGDNEYRNEMLLDGLAEAGLHPMARRDTTPDSFLDGLLRRDLYFSLRAHGLGHATGPYEDEGALRRAPDGELATRRGRPYRSLLSPVFRDATAEALEEQLSGFEHWPNAWPYAQTADDYSLFYGLDYSDIAREQFNDQTGLEAPTPPEVRDIPADRLNTHVSIDREPGIIEEDDPWLLWYTFTTRTIGGGYNAAMMEGARRANPDIKLGPVPGGMQWPLWSRGQYPPHHFGEDRFNLIYYYLYLNYWQPSVAAMYWNHVARMDNRDLPLWVTPGLYNINERTYYRNMFHLHLASGAQGLNYYTYRDGTDRPEALAEIKRLNETIVEPFHPLIGELRPVRHRVGLLVPYSTSIHENTYPLVAVYAFANLLGAQIDVEITGEEEAISGDIGRYDTVLLWHAKFLRRAAHDALVDYIDDGGTVLLDASTPIDIPGATRLEIDLAMGDEQVSELDEDPRFSFPGPSADYMRPERVETIRQALEPYCPIVVDSSDIHLVSRRAEAGGVEYIWLTHLHDHDQFVHQRTRIMGEQRGEPGAVEEAEAHVDAMADAADDRYDGSITIPAGHAPYDVFAGRYLEGEPVDDGERERVDVTMPYLGGTLIALYPEPVGHVEVTVPDTLNEGEEGPLRIRVLDDAGEPLPGHHPIHLEVRHARGTFEEWTGSHLTDDGVLELPMRPAINHPEGTWIIEARELASGVTGRATLRVP